MEQPKNNLKILKEKKKRQGNTTKYVDVNRCLYWININ